MPMNSNPYKVSIVNYYNTTPFLYGFKHSAVPLPISLELDVPSVCAQKLKHNQIDIGLVPVAILPELGHYHIVSDYCIGAIGKVDSVKLFANEPLETLTHVLLDYQSKTSIALIQVLNKHFWKRNLQFIPASEGFETQIHGTTGGVIIGDRTFGLNQYPYQYDLSEEWQKHTGLPFVFACWVSTKPINSSFIEKFNQALAFGLSHIQEAVIETPNYTKGFNAYDYLKHRISYTFDDAKKQALALFLKLL